MIPAINNRATGFNLKLIMKEKGISAKNVQNYLGLSSVQGVYHWFCGRTIPSIDNLYALSSLFEMPIDEIICGNRPNRFYEVKKNYRQRMIAYYMRLET